MDVQVVIRGVEEPGELRSFAEERLTAAIDRFADAILSVTFRLEDETGPEKGGVDKACSIDLKLRSGEIIIKEQGDDFHATINVALDRLKAALSREISKNKRGIGEG